MAINWENFWAQKKGEEKKMSSNTVVSVYGEEKKAKREEKKDMIKINIIPAHKVSKNSETVVKAMVNNMSKAEVEGIIGHSVAFLNADIKAEAVEVMIEGRKKELQKALLKNFVAGNYMNKHEIALALVENVDNKELENYLVYGRAAKAMDKVIEYNEKKGLAFSAKLASYHMVNSLSADQIKELVNDKEMGKAVKEIAFAALENKKKVLGMLVEDIIKVADKKALARIADILVGEMTKVFKTYSRQLAKWEAAEDKTTEVAFDALHKAAKNVAKMQKVEKEVKTIWGIIPKAKEHKVFVSNNVKAKFDAAIYNLVDGTNKKQLRKSNQLQKVFHAVKSNPLSGHQIPALVINKYMKVKGGDNSKELFVGTAQDCAAQYMSLFIQDYIHPEYLPGDIYTDRAFLSAAQIYIEDVDTASLLFKMYKEQDAQGNDITDEDGNVMYHIYINPLYLVRAELGGVERLVWVAQLDGANRKQWVLLETGEMVNERDIFYTAEGKKRDAWLYTGDWGVSSAGAMKQGGLFLTGTYVGEDKTQVVDWKSIINKMNCGGWELLCSMKQKYMTPQDIAQQAMRWAQALAPASVVTDEVPIPVFMNIPGKFTYTDVADGEQKELIDGMYVVLSTYIWKVFNEVEGIKESYYVNPEATVGLLMQCRPWSVLKGTAMSIDETMMEAFIRQLLPVFANGIVEIHANTATKEEIMNYYIYCLSKGKKGDFAGKAVLIIYDDVLNTYKGLWPKIEINGKTYDMPALVTDFNGQKTGFNLKYKSGMRILGFAHSDTDNGNTSVQTINGMMRVDPKRAQEFLLKKGLEFIGKKFENLENTTPVAADIVDVLHGVDYQSILAKVAPGILRNYYAPGYRSAVNTFLKGCSTKIGECKLGIKNVTLMLTVDPFVWLAGQGVLNVKNSITDIFTKTVAEGQRGIFNRFPKIMWNEILKVVNGRLANIEISALLKGISVEETAMVIRLMDSFCNGIVALPGISFVAALIGGADFDGDKGKLNMEEVETDIMWGVTPTYINKGDGAKNYNGAVAEAKVIELLNQFDNANEQ